MASSRYKRRYEAKIYQNFKSFQFLMRNLLAEFPGSLRAHKGAYVNHVADDDANAANGCIQKDLMAVFTLEDEQIVRHLSV